MAKQVINTNYPDNLVSVGNSANDRRGDPLRTAFSKINDAFDKVDANFTELYNTAAADATDRLVNGNKSVILDSDGFLNLPGGAKITTNGTSVDLVAGTAGWAELASNNGDNFVWLDNTGVYVVTNGTSGFQEWAFGKNGTLTTPLLLPRTFTAVLDSAHMTRNVALSDTPWQYVVQFQVNPNGTVETMMDQIFPQLVNPGYVSGDEFTFTEADHGIQGYTFIITLNNVVLPGGAGWTANVAVTQPPVYPSTVYSGGAIKLTSDTKSWVLGTNGVLTLPPGGDIVDSNGQSVLGAAGGASVTTGDTPPGTPALGDLWYDTIGGRTYVFYDDNWIDANPISTASATLELQTVPSTNAGAPGDKKGMVAIDSASGYFYYCISDYTDGLSVIWLRISGSGAW